MRKNICIVVYNISDIGGVNSVAKQMADEISKVHNVSFISVVDDGREPAYTFAKDITLTKLIPLRNDLKKDFLAVRKPAKKFLKENNIDVALLLGHYPGFLFAPLRPFVKTKLVFADHGALINQWDEGNVRAMRFLASKSCNKTITLTKRSLEDYKKKFRISDKKIDYIYNWIDESYLSEAEYDINSKKFISAGRFGQEKGFDNLIEAFALALPKIPNWTLDLYGDGDTSQDCKKLAKELGVSDSVNFMGMRSDVKERYKDYAAYVLPSKREGLPLVLLEAKAAKLPIISYDILTGPAEIVRDGEDGIFVPAADTEALAAAMVKLASDDALRKQYSDNSRGNLDDFSKDKILKKWLDLIESL